MSPALFYGSTWGILLAFAVVYRVRVRRWGPDPFGLWTVASLAVGIYGLVQITMRFGTMASAVASLLTVLPVVAFVGVREYARRRADEHYMHVMTIACNTMVIAFTVLLFMVPFLF